MIIFAVTFPLKTVLAPAVPSVNCPAGASVTVPVPVGLKVTTALDPIAVKFPLALNVVNAPLFAVVLPIGVF